MKKTIRLTESDIRRMVMEAMNELDWKTGVAAAKAAEKKGDPRKDKFLKYANDKFKEKYRDNDYFVSDLGTDRAGMSRSYNVDDPNTRGSHHFMNVDKNGASGNIHVWDGNGHGWQDDWTDDFNSEYHYGDDDYGLHDLRNYYTGKSRYEKGKGWMEEAVTRAIRKYLK